MTEKLYCLHKFAVHCKIFNIDKKEQHEAKAKLAVDRNNRNNEMK